MTFEMLSVIECRGILRAVTSFLISSNLQLSWLWAMEVTYAKGEHGKKENKNKKEKGKPSIVLLVGEGGKDMEHRDSWIYKNPPEK